MAVVTIEKFIEDFTNELRERNVAIFAGAGMSVDAGFVNWKGLLKPLADELNLDVEREQTIASWLDCRLRRFGRQTTTPPSRMPCGRWEKVPM
jgi:uncharacterized protein YggL (DUF469 family)